MNQARCMKAKFDVLELNPIQHLSPSAIEINQDPSALTQVKWIAIWDLNPIQHLSPSAEEVLK